jgi:hypothetical protein
MGFTLTNVSKHERTFVIGLKADPSSIPNSCFVDLSLSRDDVGTALSKTEEEEIENIHQKLKIAKRKGKKDKIEKYESRLVELGIPLPQDAEVDGDDTESTTNNDVVPPTPTTTGGDVLNVDDETVEYGPKALISTLTVVLQPNQKNRIFVELLPKSPHVQEGGSNNESDTSDTDTKEHDNDHLSTALDLDSIIEIHEKKNADESQTVRVIARQRIRPDITSAAMASHDASGPGVGGNHSSIASGTSSVPSVLPTSQG